MISSFERFARRRAGRIPDRFELTWNLSLITRPGARRRHASIERLSAINAKPL